jgi:chemotaxis family two-component system sensor kinase Cph1
MSSERVTAENVNLSNCDQELIQYSNAIQPHAVLVAMDPESGAILQTSANVQEVSATHAAELAGAAAATLIAAIPIEEIKQLPENQPPQFLLRAEFEGGPRNVFGHRVKGVVILELERDAPIPFPSLVVLNSRVREGIGYLQRSTTLAEALDRAVEVIANCTGFERVMAYQFLEDGSGHVRAEKVRPDLESYLGLHYPASDIPAPARRLFSLSWLRHLPNVNYQPVPIQPHVNPISNDTLDLSCAFSRSVSVMYTDYLRNMGVQATMIFTLYYKGKLWGLISCMHHSAPHHVPYEVRTACELIGHSVSQVLSAREEAEEYENSKRLDGLQAKLLEDMARGLGITDALLNPDNTLLEAMGAGGFAITKGHEIKTRGATPSGTDIRVLFQELRNSIENVWSTDNLSAVTPYGEQLRAHASGLLAARISQGADDFLVWFRPEYARTVSWAGNPEKPVDRKSEGGVERLMPRRSFELWKTEVVGKSRPWRPCELEFARSLRRSLMGVVFETARNRDSLAEEVARGQREIEAYLALASHDLKQPLRGIHNYAQFVSRSAKERLTEEEKGWLGGVIGLAQRMDRLIENLLSYSRAADAGGLQEETSVAMVCSRVVNRLTPLAKALSCRIQILEEQMPTVWTDPRAVEEILYHLISNAIQFNDKESREVEVGCIAGATAEIYVRDNGIGILDENQEDIFKLFHRLHRREDFGGGGGVGLATTRRLVEQIGGKIWLKSSVGEGSTFFFTIGHPRAEKVASSEY